MSTEFEEQQFQFKAWVESNGQNGGTKLHVHGQVAVKDETFLYQLVKKVDQGYYPEELFLIILPEPIPGDTRVSLKYHEELPQATIYMKITILTQTGQIFEISEIGTRG